MTPKGFYKLDEQQRHDLNDRRAAKMEIEKDLQDFRREHI